MSAQKAIFPGLIFGIFCLIGMTTFLVSTPGKEVHASSLENGFSAVVAQGSAADASGCSISAGYPDSIRQWCSLIEQYAWQNDLDPNLVSAVMLQESAGKPDAYSKSGAVGLMQVMPRDGKAARFMCKNGPCFADRPTSDQLFDPEFNVAFGTQMLAGLITHYGSVREALRAYGPMDVGYYYADLVINTMESYR